MGGGNNESKKDNQSGIRNLPCVYTVAGALSKGGAIFYVDAEPESTGEEIFELEDIHCGLHPSETSVIELV